ncbi:hypothetical protein M427DRAFT_289287 [Gonapodya prolifera JEL478]|uniref:Uncharacterized protein n=1 Tax=Gonapodya prolifera (strain JEL478) TaxID=1344416 RepID=A0A139AIU8_GONPJ|nr:hypothetical protein M427DRAFT_289287 [Gonapodya prolifera JEL478]|eukprot:KXS16710.1 hypothetical protein M427DRAFT_289287 [Gonapodya prolifera JEL478]
MSFSASARLFSFSSALSISYLVRWKKRTTMGEVQTQPYTVTHISCIRRHKRIQRSFLLVLPRALLPQGSGLLPRLYKVRYVAVSIDVGDPTVSNRVLLYHCLCNRHPLSLLCLTLVVDLVRTNDAGVAH